MIIAVLLSSLFSNGIVFLLHYIILLCLVHRSNQYQNIIINVTIEDNKEWGNKTNLICPSLQKWQFSHLLNGTGMLALQNRGLELKSFLPNLVGIEWQCYIPKMFNIFTVRAVIDMIWPFKERNFINWSSILCRKKVTFYFAGCRGLELENYGMIDIVSEWCLPGCLQMKDVN